MAHARLDQIKQDVDALLSRSVDLDGALANRLDAFPHKLNVDFVGVFFKFHQYLVDVLFRAELCDNKQFFKFNVWRIIVLDKEHAEVL